MDRYEKLERKHLGDIDKGTGIYAPKIESRESMLREQFKDAIDTLSGPNGNYHADESWHEIALKNLKHAEYGLKNIAQGKTLESEVKEVLKMSPDNRHKHYLTVREKGGDKAVDELVNAVKKERSRSRGMEI